MSRTHVKSFWLSVFTVLLIVGAMVPLASAADAQWKGDPYPLSTDPVTGKPLPEYKQQVIIDYEGRELRFADQANADAFKKDPGKYLPAVDKQIIAEQLPYYPLTKCVVSDEALGGDMGEAVDFVYRNRLIRFCCPGCKKDFLANPDKYIAELDKAIIAQQEPSYPMATCMVSGEKLGEMGKPIQRVIANHLVEFCCPMCIKQFDKDPAKYLKQIDDAKAAVQTDKQ